MIDTAGGRNGRREFCNAGADYCVVAAGYDELIEDARRSAICLAMSEISSVVEVRCMHSTIR